MSNEEKIIVKEFLYDLIKLAKEMESASDKTLGELSQKQTWMVLIDVVQHSLLTLKVHSDQWILTERALGVILSTVATISDEIAAVTSNNNNLIDINQPASEISIRIYSCYSGAVWSM